MIRKTRTIAISQNAVKKIDSLLEEIEKRTEENLTIIDMTTFIIEKFAKLACDLKIKKILEEKSENLKIVENLNKKKDK